MSKFFRGISKTTWPSLPLSSLFSCSQQQTLSMLAHPVFIKPAANTLVPLPFEHDAHTWRPAPSAICRERPLAGRGANLYWPHCRGEGADPGVFPLGKWGQTWIYKYPQERGHAAYSCILHSCILHSCCTPSRDLSVVKGRQDAICSPNDWAVLSTK